MTETVSIESDGAEAARGALERTVGEGGIAIFPADGLYGLACDPLSVEAIERILRLKGREKGKPAAVLYFSPLAMREMLDALTPLTRAAIAVLLPGAVTVVVDNPQRRYPLACRENEERLGLRLIEGPLKGAMTPIFQTSANRSGEPPPASLDQVEEPILAGADLAIDGGTLSGEPSTVVDLTAIEAGGAWEVLREGAVPYAEIEQRLTGLSLG